MEQRLRKIIMDYKNRKKNNPDQLIESCKRLPLHLAIQKAALAKYDNGEKHGHQELINDQSLKIFAKNLVQDIDLIDHVEIFSELYEIVEKAKISGIADLTIYDTAHRIGTKLGILPDHVYLHRGTLTGAINLFKLKEFKDLLKLEGSMKLVKIDKLTKKISKNDLPKIFHNFQCHEIEDILCIYKNSFDPKIEFVRKPICNFKKSMNNKSCG